jgi:hypothetical protein
MTEPDDTTEPQPFDPSAENFQPVLDYLAAADPAERDRVLAAERAGRARVSILREYPEAGPDPEAPVPGDEVPAPEGLEDDGYTRVLVSSPAYPDSTPEVLASLAE